MDATAPKKLLLLTAAITALTACGGGSSNSSNNTPLPVTPDPVVPDPDPVTPDPAVTLSGKAADGYLNNARVCLDTNSNLKCDANEPTTTTGAGGSYTLDITEEQNNTYSIVVEAIAGETIDEDNPDVTINKSYSLSAPAGETFISPLSSLVQNAMRSNAALTKEDAANQIRTALGLPEDSDILSDYVAAEDTDTHERAQFITAVLANAIEQSQTNAGGNGLSDTQFGPVLNAILGRIIAQSEAIVDAIDNGDEPADVEIVSAGDSIDDLVESGETNSELADASALLPGGVHAWSINSQVVRYVLANNRSPAAEFWDGSDWQDSPNAGPAFPSFQIVWAGGTDGWIAQDQNADCAVTATADTANALTVVCGINEYQVALSQSDLEGEVISDFLAAEFQQDGPPGSEGTLPEEIADNTTIFSADAYRLDGKATTTNPQLSLPECDTRGTEPTIEDCEPLFESTTLATLASRDNAFHWGVDESVGEYGEDINAYLAGDPSQTASGALMRLAASENDDTQIGSWQKVTVNGQVLILVTNQDNDYGNIAAEKWAFVEVEGNIYEASYIQEQSVMPLEDLSSLNGVPYGLTTYLNQQAADDIEAIISGNLNYSFSPMNRYLPSGIENEIIFDTATDLQWQRCSVGQTWTGSTCSGDASTYTWDDAITLTTPNGFRIPTIAELRTLVYCSNTGSFDSNGDNSACDSNATYDSPTILSEAFPNTSGTGVWSGTPLDSNAYLVTFNNGAVGTLNQSSSFPVRLVRGTMSPPPPPIPAP